MKSKTRKIKQGVTELRLHVETGEVTQNVQGIMDIAVESMSMPEGTKEEISEKLNCFMADWFNTDEIIEAANKTKSLIHHAQARLSKKLRGLIRGS